MQKFQSTEAKDKWGVITDTALQEPVTITKHGRPTLVVTSVRDYEELRTIKYEKLKADIQAGIDAADRGEFSTLSMDEIKAEARRRFNESHKSDAEL